MKKVDGVHTSQGGFYKMPNGAYGHYSCGDPEIDPLTYFEQEEISKTKILTDIRRYIENAKGRVQNSDIFILQIEAVEKFADEALAYLAKYAEEVGVEL